MKAIPLVINSIGLGVVTWILILRRRSHLPLGFGIVLWFVTATMVAYLAVLTWR